MPSTNPMMWTDGTAELAKASLLLLVQEHKKTCNQACGVVLFSLLRLAQAAGIELGKEEEALFR